MTSSRASERIRWTGVDELHAHEEDDAVCEEGRQPLEPRVLADDRGRKWMEKAVDTPAARRNAAPAQKTGVVRSVPLA